MSAAVFNAKEMKNELKIFQFGMDDCLTPSSSGRKYLNSKRKKNRSAYIHEIGQIHHSVRQSKKCIKVVASKQKHQKADYDETSGLFEKSQVFMEKFMRL